MPLPARLNWERGGTGALTGAVRAMNSAVPPLLEQRSEVRLRGLQSIMVWLGSGAGHLKRCPKRSLKSSFRAFSVAPLTAGHTVAE